MNKRTSIEYWIDSIQMIGWIPTVVLGLSCLLARRPQSFDCVVYGFCFGFLCHTLTYLWLEKRKHPLEMTILASGVCASLLVYVGVPSWDDLTVIKPYAATGAMEATAVAMIFYTGAYENMTQNAQDIKRRTGEMFALTSGGKDRRPKSTKKTGQPKARKLRIPNPLGKIKGLKSKIARPKLPRRKQPEKGGADREPRVVESRPPREVTTKEEAEKIVKAAEEARYTDEKVKKMADILAKLDDPSTSLENIGIGGKYTDVAGDPELLHGLLTQPWYKSKPDFHRGMIEIVAEAMTK
jgi:hypothetical protein